METNPKYQAALAALTEKFKASLPEKQALLRQRAADWRVTRSADALKEVVSVAHKLAGSAGSYGFDDLGLAARALENEVRTWPEVPGEPAQAEFDRLLNLLLTSFPKVD